MSLYAAALEKLAALIPALESFSALQPVIQASLLPTDESSTPITTTATIKSRKQDLQRDLKVGAYQRYFSPLAQQIPASLTCMVTGLTLPAHLITAARLLPRNDRKVRQPYVCLH